MELPRIGSHLSSHVVVTKSLEAMRDHYSFRVTSQINLREKIYEMFGVRSHNRCSVFFGKAGGKFQVDAETPHALIEAPHPTMRSLHAS